ncbi:FtsX-like permease family protein [Rhodopirellula sp. MGV]|uniref:FtsX-like permease family protein n=1 Tax=Rhodopirellula sp. MGV TaxID=2023130 RepID=UPI000B96AE13|nr:FtsX family ABC transporter permease [Rhodopirellula sp. MGV]OYP39195.1 ABC transporter [Rhodopirellula sp. MGV]PNY35429.1 ABC transporter [Rhodopirellula baltica]
MKVFKLAIAFLFERKTRAALTTIATATAVCMVIWVTSSYEALHKTYDEYANLALGRYELAIAPISGDDTHFIDADVLKPLRDDESVAAVDPMWAGRVALAEQQNFSGPKQESPRRRGSSMGMRGGPSSGPSSGPGGGPQGRLPSLMVMATDATEPPFEMADGQWIAPENADGVVVRADVAKRRGIALHDPIKFELPRPDEHGELQRTATVIGIMNAPTLPGAEAAGIPMLTPSSGEVFVPITMVEQISGAPFQISLLGVSVKPNADINRFRFGWAPKLSDYEVPLQFQEAFEIEEALDQAAAAQNVRMQSFAATGIAMLVAMLVTFCSLSMGVTERIRQYAILRAVVLTRAQVALLIIIEGLTLGMLGLLVGTAIGWSLLKTAEILFGRLLYHGVGFGGGSLAFAAIASFGGALFAAIIPAYRATRVKPIDAMAPRHEGSLGSTVTWQSIAIGFALISTGPILTFVFPPSEKGVWVAMGGVFICVAIGFVVLAPSIVVLVDRCCGALFAKAFGFDAKLLASQLTNNVWRTVGAAVSMAFGLGLFVGIQVWGFTMLEAFIPGEWTPDAIAVIKLGLPPETAVTIGQMPGVDARRCLPLVVEQPRLVDDLTHSAERASVTRQDNVVIVGLDPAAALGGERPLLEFEWVAGNPEDAIALMESGHACVVPDHFLAETGLHVGETIALDPPRNSGQTASYTIAGAVHLKGWHWQTKLTGLRTRTHRAAALVFADFDSVAGDFDLPLASHVWFSFSDDQADVESIQSSIEKLVATVSQDTNQEESSVRVVPVQGIRDHLQGAARRWLWVISVVPLVTLLIACLGVLNVILASVRARHWELGVLRSIGFTSSELARAILAEGMMIALIASLLSVGFGILVGWCGAGLAQYISFFGGLHPPMVLPWLPIASGVGLVLLLGILTAAWPAYSIRRTRPMKLLQSGGDLT